jgi:hypothetical protein
MNSAEGIGTGDGKDSRRPRGVRELAWGLGNMENKAHPKSANALESRVRTLPGGPT